ncbi:MAG: methionine biosynthesis protein MetW [Bacteriovoracia bacterium]
MNSTDNRNYFYAPDSHDDRAEYPVISDWVPPRARVLDLGCGDGALLAKLRDGKQCAGQGIELSASGVESARRKGLQVNQGSIDQPLKDVTSGSFDYAVCNVTVQMVMFPEVLMSEMKRVARRQIISFPNFGHWSNRWDLLCHGRMPHPLLFGYDWHSTGHIHQLGVRDFEDYVAAQGWRILDRRHLGSSRTGWKQGLVQKFPGLLAITSIYHLEMGA